MDISRAAGMTGMQAVTGGGDTMLSADSAAREQAMKNAVNQLQARYGEKPK